MFFHFGRARIVIKVNDTAAADKWSAQILTFHRKS